jgi:hypothetical protein
VIRQHDSGVLTVSWHRGGRDRAVFGAVPTISALSALFLGVLLAG